MTAPMLRLAMRCALSLVLSCVAAQACAGGEDRDAASLRRIILGSRHLGAHGMGYNRASLETLQRELQPADIPALIALSHDRELHTGALFALASQCEAALEPVREAAREQRLDWLDALDTVDLVTQPRCSAAASARARTVHADIVAARDAFHAARRGGSASQNAPAR